MKYIHFFDTIENHDKVYYGDGYKEPWLALTEQGNKLTYNKHVTLTFEAISATTVPIYYTKESVVNGTPDMTVELTANEPKKVILNRNKIYSIGVIQFNPTTTEIISSNVNIKSVSIVGKILEGNAMFDFYNINSPAFVKCDVSNLDTSEMTEMYAMFKGCQNLTTLDVSNWNTSKVTDMQWMFDDCTSLETLDVSNWNTSNVTKMLRLFGNCTSLETLDVSNWDLSKVTNMAGMFFGCQNLTTLDLSNWDLSNTTIVALMFKNCTSLNTVKVTNCSSDTQNKILNQLKADLNSYTWTLADGVITRG